MNWNGWYLGSVRFWVVVIAAIAVFVGLIFAKYEGSVLAEFLLVLIIVAGPSLVTLVGLNLFIRVRPKGKVH